MSKKPLKNPTLKKEPRPVEDDSAITFRWVREGIEMLAIALALAFLFKTFEVEAFVIPTGSMAPTLMGRHKDVHCPQCDYRYRVSASEEFDEGNQGLTSRRKANREPAPQVVAGTCPICRYTQYFGKDNPEKKVYFSYNGDRIFVFKYLFDILQPQRWNVTVFRFPGGPQTNYIKRLVGLENESIRIQNGDVFVRKEGENDFRIARKPAVHLLSMLQIVNDNDYANPKLHAIGWPRSWADETESFGQMPKNDAVSEPAWFATEDLRSFQTEGKEPTVRWLHYRHIVPDSNDWVALSQGELPAGGVRNNPQLIMDFSAYNSGIVRFPPDPGSAENADFLVSNENVRNGDRVEREIVCRADPDSTGFNWVGDLVLECGVEVLEPRGKIALRLVKGGVAFVCEIDLSTGKGTLSTPQYSGLFPPISVATPLHTAGKYHVRFANVDEQLRLWIDGEELSLESHGEYDALCDQPLSPVRRDRMPGPLDLTPVSIGSDGAPLRVEHLKIYRDLYYTAADPGHKDLNCDLAVNPFYSIYNTSREDAEFKNAEILSNPNYWSAFGKTRRVEFTLEKDQFFMLGDNSPKSSDARVWTALPGGGQYVHRSFLVGRAGIVYWPHGWRIPLINLPFIPNPGDMRFID